MAVTVRDAGIRDLTVTAVADFVKIVAKKVEKRARFVAPNFTGKLQRSITALKPKVTGLHVRAKVTTDSGYGLFPEEGTGIFGPKGAPIRPKKAPFLVFQPRGLGHIIRVKSVRGQPGQHYMRDSLIAIIHSI